jgi:ADP-ribosylglycohydrolase
MLAAMISRALAGQSREAMLAAATQLGGMPLRAEIHALAAGWQEQQAGRRKPPAAALRVLDRAVRCFVRSRGIADGFARALDSPGDDRDAICAVYGALAGAHYGDEAIPAELRARVAGMQRIEQLADRLHQHRSVAHGIPA